MSRPERYGKSWYVTAERVMFTVEGVPVSQAGTRTVPTSQGNRQISTGGQGLEAWRNKITAHAQVMAARGGRVDGPVRVTAMFYFTFPKSRPPKRGVVCAPKTTKPDLDKLVRAVGDSLTAGGLIEDDARIVEWAAAKFEQTYKPACVEIFVEPRGFTQ